MRYPKTVLQYPIITAQQDGANAPLPAPETRLNGADLDRLRRSLDSRVSDNTRAMYNSAWRSFESWAQARGALAAIHKAAGHEDPTDNEGVRRIMQGIARAHGKGQKQARPLTAEALAAVKATARGRRLWETGSARNRRTGLPGTAGWTWRCWPPCGTSC